MSLLFLQLRATLSHHETLPLLLYAHMPT